MSNHIFQTCYNLSVEQEQTGEGGASRDYTAIDARHRVEFTLEAVHLLILCDLANAGKSCRMLLRRHDGLVMYIILLMDPYFQVSALESILAWLQEETARVEDELAKPKSLDALLKCFVSAKAGSFENLLGPFLNICNHSMAIAIDIAKAQFFRRVTEMLSNSKAVVKLNLLRILRAVCDVHALLVERYGIHEAVAALRRKDGAVLVPELPREIEPSLARALKPSLRGAGTPKAPKRRTTRRTTSDMSGICTPSPPLGTGPMMNNPRVTSTGAGLGPLGGVGSHRGCMLAVSRGSLASARDGAEEQQQ